MTYKKSLALIVLFFIGISGAWLIIESSGDHDNHNGHESHDAHDSEDQDTDSRGPHGGWLLGDDFQLEVKIFEDGVPPELRIFGFDHGNPIPAEQFKVEVQVIRLGTDIENVNFKPNADYQLGDLEIYEPHSFLLKVNAIFENKTYQWEIEQLEGRIQLNDEDAAQSGISIENASPRQISPSLLLPGEIDFNKDKLAHVVPRLKGVVKSVYVNQGKKVRKGDLLAIIESRELTQLKGEYQAAARRLDLAKRTFERENRLWKGKKTSEQEYLIAKQSHEEAEINRDIARQQLQALGFTRKQIDTQKDSQNNFGRLEIRAPLSGTVVEKHITIGEVVSAEKNIFQIADLSVLWGNLKVHAQDIPKVHLKQKVIISSDALGLQSHAVVDYLDAHVKESTQSIDVRVLIDNKNGQWRPGLFVNVNAILQPKSASITVRKDAIQTFRDWNVVFARFGNYFEIRPVELGISDDNWVEIVSGLTKDQPYAATNSYLIKADIGKSGASHDH